MNDAGTDLVLVAMPWEEPTYGSIQVATLLPVARRAGFSAVGRSFHVAWLHYLAKTSLGIDDYRAIANDHWDIGLGDWIFAEAASTGAAEEDVYLPFARSYGVPAAVLDAACAMRAIVDDFLAACAAEVLALCPRAVGFTVAFSQTLPAIALARALKTEDPDVRVVFGGAGCDGAMGAALHRSFAVIDLVVRGEGERVLPGVLADIVEGREIRRQAGLCVRDRTGTWVQPQTAPPVPMAEVPMPDYDEYFERLGASRAARSLAGEVRILVEGARGCWWGERAHCTFCGLNGSMMEFRSKPTERLVGEVLSLARRHCRLGFDAVDNILDRRYFDTLLPALARLRGSGIDLDIFWETKANLRREQVRLLRDAGIHRFQPGIESLSTPILKLMRKGVTALQNIRLLKWAARYGVRPTWNIIYGFPGEPPQEYLRMAALMPSLTHLRPPGLVRLYVQRFSPYHDDPAAWGLRVTGAAHYYRHLYTLDDATLADLAYDFAYEHLDGRDPETYIGPLRDALACWERGWATGRVTLAYECGPGFLRIVDRRPGIGPATYLLDDLEARAYLACDAGASPTAVLRTLGADGTGLDVGDVRALLEDLERHQLVLREGDRYLSLAIPANPDAESQVVAAAEDVPQARAAVPA